MYECFWKRPCACLAAKVKAGCCGRVVGNRVEVRVRTPETKVKGTVSVGLNAKDLPHSLS